MKMVKVVYGSIRILLTNILLSRRVPVNLLFLKMKQGHCLIIYLNSLMYMQL